MSNSATTGPLAGISTDEQEIMGRLLRMKPAQQKTAKPNTPKGDAQRLRREKERQQPNTASGGD
jgi:hypothetical protein